MSTSASTLALSSLHLNTRTQSLCNTNTPTDSVHFVLGMSAGIRSKLISIPSSSIFNFDYRLRYQIKTMSSRFVRNVAASSTFDQEEDVLSDDGDETDFRPEQKIFVGNLPFSVDSSQLAGLFESVGNVQMVEVIYDKTTGRSRGFGFVTMSTTNEVDAAVQKFNGYEIEGRPLRVNSGPPPPKDNDGPPRGDRFSSSFNNENRLYVGNLSWGVDNSELESFFSEVGDVIEARVVYDKESGRSRGFGFVTYSSAEAFNKAIESLDGADLDGRSVRVSQAAPRPKRQF